MTTYIEAELFDLENYSSGVFLYAWMEAMSIEVESAGGMSGQVYPFGFKYNELILHHAKQRLYILI